MERNSLQAIALYVQVKGEIASDTPTKMFLYNTQSAIANGNLYMLEYVLAHWRRAVEYSGYLGDVWVEGEIRPYDELKSMLAIDIYAQILKAIDICNEVFDESKNYTQEATNKIY